MTKLLAIFVLLLACVTVNAQSQATNKDEKSIGPPIDEIVVSSDFKVRRKSKENRQGKESLLASVPSVRTTSNPTGKSTALASRLVLSDGSSVTPDRRTKRHAGMANYRRLPKEGMAKYLLRSRQR